MTVRGALQIAWASGCVLVGGCQGWRTVEPTPSPVLPDGVTRIRATLSDGRRLDVRDARLTSDGTLVGTTAGARPVRVATSDVTAVAVRGGSAWRTTALIAGGVAVVATVGMYVAVNESVQSIYGQ